MIVGMDFGTTNSGMAVYDGNLVKLVPLDPANSNPNVVRTALYITNEQSVAIGRDAVNRYFDDNVGRPVRMERVWVGEVEFRGADMYYVTDVYVWADVLSPGRLFLSVKSGLRDPDYQGTVIGQFYYSLEDLIALYMELARQRAEKLLGSEINEVVLGRPVHFSTDPEADRLAQDRLLQAAFRAGYEKVYLQYEPVAAAYHYAAAVGEAQNILVFDFGGGTLDLTVMHIDGHGGRQVLATGGLPIAGDLFDKKLVRSKIPKHFGEGTLYGPEYQRLPLPKWIFDMFSDWQSVIELQTPKSRQLLREIAKTADDRKGIEALISLVTNNYSLQLFDAVEATKRKLSTDMASLLSLDGPEFRVSELFTRSEFEQIIRKEINEIEQHVKETVESSGLRHEEIDAVIRTGGSSSVPAFRYMLIGMFGRQKVKEIDTFSSVTSGLGILAHSIQNGEMEARAFTRADRKESMPHDEKQRVASVNLDLMKRRIAASEKGRETASEGERALLLLEAGGRLTIQHLPPGALEGTQAHAWQDGGPDPKRVLVQILEADLDDQLLLVTTHYRFLLATLRQLLDLDSLSLTISSYFRLRKGEYLCAAAPWEAIKKSSDLFVITNRGFARAYPLAHLIEPVEGPSPYQFKQPLPGIPFRLRGSDGSGSLVAALDSGRVARFSLSDIPAQGIQAINCQDGERMAAALIAEEDEELLLVAGQGFGRRVTVEAIPEAARPNTRGKVVISRRPLAGIASITGRDAVYLVTPAAMHAIDLAQLPLDESGSTKAYRLSDAPAGQPIVAVLD